jgi:hypothetical protein
MGDGKFLEPDVDAALPMDGLVDRLVYTQYQLPMLRSTPLSECGAGRRSFGRPADEQSSEKSDPKISPSHLRRGVECRLKSHHKFSKQTRFGNIAKVAHR